MFSTPNTKKKRDDTKHLSSSFLGLAKQKKDRKDKNDKHRQTDYAAQSVAEIAVLYCWPEKAKNLWGGGDPPWGSKYGARPACSLAGRVKPWCNFAL